MKIYKKLSIGNWEMKIHNLLSTGNGEMKIHKLLSTGNREMKIQKLLSTGKREMKIQKLLSTGKREMKIQKLLRFDMNLRLLRSSAAMQSFTAAGTAINRIFEGRNSTSGAKVGGGGCGGDN